MTSKTLQRCVRLSTNMFSLPVGRNKHFSYILQRNKVVGLGWNNAIKTNSLSNRFGHYAGKIHSEIAALKSVIYKGLDYRRCILVNVRLNNTGELLMSRPCKSCRNMIDFFEFEQVWYTNQDGEFVQL